MCGADSVLDEGLAMGWFSSFLLCFPSSGILLRRVMDRSVLWEEWGL